MFSLIVFIQAVIQQVWEGDTILLSTERNFTFDFSKDTKQQ